MSKQQPTTTRTRSRSKRTLRIFLNYRREDSSGHAGRLYDDLAERFGDDRIFMDIDKIEPGLDFDESIERALDSCDVVLAMIGRQWTTIADGKGVRRLDNPDDYVRLELEAALEKGMRLIPVRVQGTDMPSSMELPESLRALARRQAVELSDNRWRYDVDVLASALERLAVENAEKAREEQERIAQEQAKVEQAQQEQAERQRLAADEKAQRAETAEAERQRIAADAEQAELETRERERIAAETEARRVADESAARDQRERERIAAEEAELKQAAEVEAEQQHLAAEAERERTAHEAAERKRREQERVAARQAELERTAQEDEVRARTAASTVATPADPLQTERLESRTPLHRRPAALAAAAVLAVALGAVIAVPLIRGGGENAAALIPDVAWPPGESRPSIDGNARVGMTLSASRGAWRNSPTTFGFQWLRCTSGGSCANVDGATSAKYELKGEDVGNRMRVVVTATNAEGAGTSRSNATPRVVAAYEPPMSSAAPTVSGTPREGERLLARGGKWEGSARIERTLVWKRCNASGRSCVAIDGGRGESYVLRAQDVGHRIRVEERASNVAGKKTARSTATGVVAAKFVPIAPPAPQPPVRPPSPPPIDPVPPPIDP